MQEQLNILLFDILYSKRHSNLYELSGWIDLYVENEKLMIDATPSSAGLHSLVVAEHLDNSYDLYLY